MARRRLATPSILPMVISGSATRRSSFAFGSVVRISSCLISDAAMLQNIASRLALVRLKLRPELRWRMVVFPVFFKDPANNGRARAEGSAYVLAHHALL